MTSLSLQSELIYAQILPSYPLNGLADPRIPDVPKSVKNIQVTFENLDRNDSLKVDYIRKFYFRENGKIKKAAFINPETQLSWKEYFYDEHGRITLNILARDKPYVFYNYQYFDSLLVTKRYEMNPEGQILRKNYIEYHSSLMKPKAFKTFRNDSTLADSTLLTYTKYGDLKARIFLNTPNGYGITVGKSITGDKDEFTAWPSDTTQYEYKYNAKGEILERKKFDSGELEEVINYVRKADTLITITKDIGIDQSVNNIVKRKEFGPFTETTYEWEYFPKSRYFEKNSRLKWVEKFEEKNVIERNNYTYEITRDNKGQMIQQKQFKDGKLTQIITHEIEYWN